MPESASQAISSGRRAGRGCLRCRGVVGDFGDCRLGRAGLRNEVSRHPSRHRGAPSVVKVHQTGTGQRLSSGSSSRATRRRSLRCWPCSRSARSRVCTGTSVAGRLGWQTWDWPAAGPLSTSFTVSRAITSRDRRSSTRARRSVICAIRARSSSPSARAAVARQALGVLARTAADRQDHAAGAHFGGGQEKPCDLVPDSQARVASYSRKTPSNSLC